MSFKGALVNVPAIGNKSVLAFEGDGKRVVRACWCGGDREHGDNWEVFGDCSVVPWYAIGNKRVTTWSRRIIGTIINSAIDRADEV